LREYNMAQQNADLESGSPNASQGGSVMQQPLHRLGSVPSPQRY